MLWGIVVPAVCWSLWLGKNKRTFEDKEYSLEDVCNIDKFRDAWWASSYKEFEVLSP